MNSALPAHATSEHCPRPEHSGDAGEPANGLTAADSGLGHTFNSGFKVRSCFPLGTFSCWAVILSFALLPWAPACKFMGCVWILRLRSVQ